MMQKKSPTTTERREGWTILSEILTKLAQQIEFQLAVVLRLYANTQKQLDRFSFYQTINQWLEEFC